MRRRDIETGSIAGERRRHAQDRGKEDAVPITEEELDQRVQGIGERFDDAPEWQRDLEMWLEGNRYAWREMIASASEALRVGKWTSVLVDERSAHFEALLLDRITQRLSKEFGVSRPKFYLTEPEGLRKEDGPLKANVEYLRDKDLGERTLFLSELIGSQTINTFAYALRELEQPFDVMTVVGGDNVEGWSKKAQEQLPKRRLTDRLLGVRAPTKPQSQSEMEDLFRDVRVYNAKGVPVDLSGTTLGGIFEEMRGDAEDGSYESIRNRLSGMQKGSSEDLRTIRREMTDDEGEMRRYLRQRIRDCADDIYEEIFSEATEGSGAV